MYDMQWKLCFFNSSYSKIKLIIPLMLWIFTDGSIVKYKVFILKTKLLREEAIYPPFSHYLELVSKQYASFMSHVENSLKGLAHQCGSSHRFCKENVSGEISQMFFFVFLWQYSEYFYLKLYTYTITKCGIFYVLFIME